MDLLEKEVSFLKMSLPRTSTACAVALQYGSMKINILEFLLKKLEHYAQNIHSYLLYVVHHQDLPVQISAATIKNNGTK